MVIESRIAPSSASVEADAPKLPRTAWTRIPPMARDLITFLVVASFAFAPFGGVSPTAWINVLFVAAALVVVVLRRRWPLPALALSAAFFVVVLVIGQFSPYPGLPVAVAVFAVTRTIERRRALIITGCTLVVLLAATVLLGQGNLLDPRAFSLVTIVAAAGGLGDAARSRRDYIVAITERALRAERTRETEAQRRVAEDRLRIARDLHDVVAHQIAVINLHAGVASSTLRNNPDSADESLATIRQASRSVLAEIGGLMNMLRAGADGESAELAPIGGLDRLGELVAGFDDVGLRVQTQVDGSLIDIPPAVDLVAYRAVQEGLTNAHKHGGGTAHLQVHRDMDTLCVRISNPAGGSASADSGSGYGLQGLRERVESVRGQTRVDATQGGRFVLEVSLPLWAETGAGQERG